MRKIATNDEKLLGQVRNSFRKIFGDEVQGSVLLLQKPQLGLHVVVVVVGAVRVAEFKKKVISQKGLKSTYFEALSGANVELMMLKVLGTFFS